ncbi:hypothetical protein EJ05DRAFT_488870 [Pseudovirgaria hyperparasitica]|uniref:Uncharacterized protein n=1 Tax=Pseudovirgaria hyperparasitica TaxID=470096 RepID=A0A6A6VWW9_9PEZI|nr:uncharacterized protein EJ05DRAFT_488870 [Pseudovirgaria hyperparasitica]KAF2754713.1 hypothetical protein EJ05DRAFT_488870 [Pseudovirgaria hyperparasitica]
MRAVALALTALQASLAWGQITITRARPSPSEIPPSDENGSPTSIAVPEETGEPCAAIADTVTRANANNIIAIDAQVAYDCLRSVPVLQTDAEQTIDGILNMLQFQSNLGFLANPPDDYFNDPVDLVAGMEDIRNRLGSGEYQNEYDFEAAIGNLLGRSYDGHLAYDGYAFAGAFRWRRDPDAALISASTDGTEPRIYSARDANQASASEVTQIDGRPVTDVIAEEAAYSSYHDPDARWNTMFVLQPAESSGFFVNPRNYPGPSTSISWENGTTTEYPNAAIVQDPDYWSDVFDGQSFYNTFVSVRSLSGRRLRARSESPRQRVPKRLQIPRDASLTQTLSRDGSVPESYPDPVVQHDAEDVPLAGFFIDTDSMQNVAVLMMQTFDAEDADQFQAVIQDFLAEAQSRGSERIIVDVRTNGGGLIFLGYEAYKQFFPDVEPYGGSRYRYHEAVEILGSSISQLSRPQNPSLYASPFNYHAYLDQDLNAFTSWQAMSGPTTFNNDQFTNILRYNLSDPLLIQSDRFGLGIQLTGYGDRANFTTPPFPPDNIIILSDGICASTCAIFVELMTRQSGVRTFTLGGRPQPGPMQAVGGTKGSSVLDLQYLLQLSSAVVSGFAASQREAQDWSAVLPLDFGIVPVDASVNFHDSIRLGTEGSGVPTQFINDTSSCRLFYTPAMYFDVREVWGAVADAVWGGSGGGLDAGRCVGGSDTDERAQVGANPNGGGAGDGGDGGAAGENAAAVGVGPRGWVVAVGVLLASGVGLVG